MRNTLLTIVSVTFLLLMSFVLGSRFANSDTVAEVECTVQGVSDEPAIGTVYMLSNGLRVPENLCMNFTGTGVGSLIRVVLVYDKDDVLLSVTKVEDLRK